MPTAPAGWYADPERPGQLRYWDGKAWTQHRAPMPSHPASATPQPNKPLPQPLGQAKPLPQPLGRAKPLPRSLGQQRPSKPQKGWVRRHPIWTTVFAVIALIVAIGILNPNDAPKKSESSTAQQSGEGPADTQPPTTLVSYKEGWTQGPVTIDISAKDDCSSPEDCTIYYSTDGGKTWNTGSSVTVKEEGKHTVLIYAKDAAGNKEDQGYCKVSIDSAAPKTKTLNSPSIEKGDPVTLKYRIDDRTPKVQAYIRLTGAQSKTIDLGSEPTGRVRAIRLRANLALGSYTWAVYATDQAGNKAKQRASGRLTVRAPSSSGGPTIWVGITESGECYHRLTCYQWTKDPEGNSKVTLTQAKAMGLRPCSICDPPR
jgi:hypothetical protein